MPLVTTEPRTKPQRRRTGEAHDAEWEAMHRRATERRRSERAQDAERREAVEKLPEKGEVVRFALPAEAARTLREKTRETGLKLQDAMRAAAHGLARMEPRALLAELARLAAGPMHYATAGHAAPAPAQYLDGRTLPGAKNRSAL